MRCIHSRCHRFFKIALLFWAVLLFGQRDPLQSLFLWPVVLFGVLLALSSVVGYLRPAR